MSTVLVINGHPLTKDESNSLKLLDKFMEVYKSNNPSDLITVVNLYESDLPEIDATMLRGWSKLKKQEELDAKEEDTINRFEKYTNQFLDADKVVVANPLWNLGVPTKLKAWIDAVNVAGKTFKYTANGPVPLTSGKKAIHMQSNGGQYNGHDLASGYIKTILNFVGVDDVKHIAVEGIDFTPDKAEEILSVALNEVESAAKGF